MVFKGDTLHEAVAQLQAAAASGECDISSVAVNQRQDDRVEVVAILTPTAVAGNQRRAAVWVTVVTAIAAVFIGLNGSVLWSSHPTVPQLVQATSWCLAWTAAIAYVWRKNGPHL